MARIARVVAPGYPHHITQRGNRRQRTFFCNEDYAVYLDLMREWCAKHAVEIWSYCLMPNHVHFVAVPLEGADLCRAIGEAHRRYTRYINFREGWRGYLWQGRFSSFVMDEPHLIAAVRYVELNPVRAGLAGKAWDYPWSSAAAHLCGVDDRLVRVAPLNGIIGDWKRYLEEPLSEAEAEKFRKASSTGRPLGNEQFVAGLERQLIRPLHRGKPGPRVHGN